ncbi:DELTA-thalatoxin-Avl1a-like [Astyanax mexicanus]|uniref:DELTA-thalatoxin-Avl1a-like n=1 Tax=Astyanax mexicanus TaxID=7994 RepID=A0A8B9HGK4_ASTMX|nr:DELTA-thalatoxin-Avl1a-like [Astyanax mexicanus]
MIRGAVAVAAAARRGGHVLLPMAPVGMIAGKLFQFTDRNVTIKITNSSCKYTLKHPRTYTYSGYCNEPPELTIIENAKKTCSFTKTTASIYGSAGVLTYQILTKENLCIGQLAIMFSVPYNFGVYENWFALGIFEPDVLCDENLYHRMYNERGPFTRTNGTGCSIDYSKNTVLVVGTMSPQSKSVILVELCDVKGNK